MIAKPAKVPQNKVTSVDVARFEGGLFLNGAQNAPMNSFVEAKDVELDRDGYIVPRRKLAKFLPDTVETTYQKLPVLWEGEIYYFTADENKVKFCQEGDLTWTDCGGTNSFTTNNGGIPKFYRVLDKVLVVNGKNGDRLAYVDLASVGFPIVKFTAVTDPATAPTAAYTNLAAGSYNIYYAYSFSGVMGETKLSPPLTKSINYTRDLWSTLTSPGSLEITRAAAPAGATYWNIYIAEASTSGTITDEDFLLLAAKLDLATDKFVDNGTLDINLGSPAPLANSTEGPRVDQGIITDGNPILFADQDNPYAIHIGGGGVNALDFSISNGGYRAEPEKGTNYYPTTIIGFRNGQGIPSLTVLFSNTEGLSKQAVLEQQTITYGDSSFTVWGLVEQHYGAAGVAAPNSPINYNGRLMFLSTDGFMSMETAVNLQNVLSTKDISSPIDSYVRSIKSSAMEKVVGAGWNNKYMWLVPSKGFNTPQEILILDTNSKGVEGNGAWYTMSIAADWIGVVTPDDSSSIVYISQGNKTYKLIDFKLTFDLSTEGVTPFSTRVRGPLMGMGGEAHNSWQASVQAMFYIMELTGDITVGVNYRNQSGNIKTKTRTYHGPVAAPSYAGGWGDPIWTYAHFDQVPGWGYYPVPESDSDNTTLLDVRIPVRIDDITNEAQWFLRTEIGYNNFKLRAVSFEGISLGIRPDLQ